jgi:hypothetical protein
MNLKVKIRKMLRESYGDIVTNLEGEYQDKITEALLNDDFHNKMEWATYNQVVLELKHNIKDNIKLRELLYRLTDKEDPNKACIEVIREVKIKTPELDRLYYKIINFIN